MYPSAVEELGRLTSESDGLLGQDWRTKLMFSLLPYVESQEAYKALKTWLDEQQAQAAAARRHRAELDAQAAALWLVRDRYWPLYRIPRGKQPPGEEAAGRATAALTLVIDRQVLPDDDEASEQIKQRVHEVQRRMKRETGFLVPTPFIRGDPHLAKGAYEVWVHEIPVPLGPESGQVVQGAKLCPRVDLCRQCGLRGTPDRGGIWLRGKALERATREPLPLREPYEVLLERVIRRHLASFVGLQEVQALVDDWNGKHPDDPLPGEITGHGVPVRFVRLLRGLAAEEVSVANLRLVCQTFIAAGAQPAVSSIVEAVRQKLAPALVHGREPSRLLGLSDAFEACLLACLTGPPEQPVLAIMPAEAAAMVDTIRAATGSQAPADDVALVVRKPALRIHVRHLLAAALPDLPVLSENEVSGSLGKGLKDQVDLPLAARRQ
jgi:flagellar biosynthesis component FlhA